jgi:hypothetical protein
MAVLMTQDLPVGREDVEAVTAEAQARESLPDGLILHTFTVTPQGVHVVDVWEARRITTDFETSASCRPWPRSWPSGTFP